MALTSSPSEKFAFLFSGSVTSRYLNDLERVFTTLADYYGYPKAKIWVVFGSAATPVLTAYPGLSTAPNITNINGDVTALQTVFDSFAKEATYPWTDTPEPTNVALIYCTGLGGNTGGSQLDISGAGTFVAGTFVDPAWFKTRFTTIHDHLPLPSTRFGQTAYLHLIMQQEFSGGFLGSINTVPGLPQWSFTSACGSAEPAIGTTEGDTYGSYFTLGWTNALRFVTDSMGKYADESGTIDLAFHVSLEQAEIFAAAGQYGLPAQPLTSIPVWNTAGDVHYLGKPAFFIRDGDDRLVPQPWYESPDIYINAVDNDLYNVGVNNTVHIITKITGTHPVRSFWIGAKHFGSGIGDTYAIQTENMAIGSGLTSVLKPGDSHEFSYVQMFDVTTTETHRCIKARAQLLEIMDEEIDEYGDWSDALIQANDFEAQRNVDPLDMGGPPEDTTPPPGDAETPDTDPPKDEEEDVNNTGDRSLKNLRGFKEHIYTINNPFKEKRKFKIVLHKEFEEYSEIFSFKFLKLTEVKKRSKLEPLRTYKSPYPNIILTIDSLEKINILFYLALKPGVKMKKEIRLPIEIFVEKKGRRRIKNLRKTTLNKMSSTFVPVSGITIKVNVKDISIKGIVLNKQGKPVPDARVFIRSINGRQASVLKTDEKGKYLMPHINPDSYKMFVKTKEWETKEKIVNLNSKDLVVDFSEKDSTGKKEKNK